MNSAIGITIIIIVFLCFIGIIFLLMKKNIFSSNTSKQTVDESEENILIELQTENESLEKEIAFLEKKNRKLRLKIDRMRNIIQSLEKQKSQLENSSKKLKDLREQKEEALVVVAHDMKNPAFAIKGFVKLLESYDLTAQEQQDILKGLMETSSRLIKLADEFNNVISEDYTPFKLNKKNNDIREIVESIVKANRAKAITKEIKINLYQPKSEVMVECDKDKMMEVVDNFLGNAVKYCPKESNIKVISKVEGNYVFVDVTDDGYGLTETELNHAFDKGTKLSNKPTGDETRAGLGLWIAKKIVEAHNGKVWVKSQKGFGSTFSFKIPLKK
ncbi:MAG: hypothetical protein CR986_06155 [Ignavibacteriae bacterium]|nr:MAG: hypothetical protein CR986_06155 [Ignavibacteriota bacterium]